MGKLIILRGNSGSGKTTVARELQKKFGHNICPFGIPATKDATDERWFKACGTDSC